MNNEPPNQNQNLLTVPQACELLQVSRSSLYEMMKLKDFPSKRVKGLGRRVLRDKLALWWMLHRDS